MRKGEMSSTQIVSLVLAIVAFLLVLIVVVSFRLETTSEDDVCRLSVLTRGSLPQALQNFAALKCTTKKICITNGKGRCEDAFAGEKIDIIKIPDGKTSEQRERAARIIEETSAETMYNCWKMMGEGKIDLFRNAQELVGFSSALPTCVICSRVAVDKNVDAAILEEVDVNSYLRRSQVPGSSMTYLQAFTDRGVQAYAKVDESLFNEGVNEYNKKVEAGLKLEGSDADRNLKKLQELKLKGASGEGPNRQAAFVFIQIKTISVGEVLKNLGEAGATVAVTGFVTPAVGKVATRGTKLVWRIAGWLPWGRAITATAVGVGTAATAGYGAYNAKQGQLVAVGRCGNFAGGNEEQPEKGCSVVQGVNYYVPDINALCSSLQGSP